MLLTAFDDDDTEDGYVQVQTPVKGKMPLTEKQRGTYLTELG